MTTCEELGQLHDQKSEKPSCHRFFEPELNLVGTRTFFPAYLPRVMMATRPTLRTIRCCVSMSVRMICGINIALTLHRRGCWRIKSSSLGVIEDREFPCGRVLSPSPEHDFDW